MKMRRPLDDRRKTSARLLPHFNADYSIVVHMQKKLDLCPGNHDVGAHVSTITLPETEQETHRVVVYGVWLRDR